MVLERFVRLDDAADPGRGRQRARAGHRAELVAAHGGQVTIADSPLGGARVEVRLPARALPTGEPQESAQG